MYDFSLLDWVAAARRVAPYRRAAREFTAMVRKAEQHSDEGQRRSTLEEVKRSLALSVSEISLFGPDPTGKYEEIKSELSGLLNHVTTLLDE